MIEHLEDEDGDGGPHHGDRAARVVLEVENARYFRLKNHEPEAIIQRGGSQWMVFPWLRKDGTVTGDVDRATHSGTFGWAVRYEGP